jgi:hypothetical protein
MDNLDYIESMIGMVVELLVVGNHLGKEAGLLFENIHCMVVAENKLSIEELLVMLETMLVESMVNMVVELLVVDSFEDKKGE